MRTLLLNRMVEYALNYNLVFQALADETRRDILARVIDGEKTITELASRYAMSFAAIAKHLRVLEVASLVTKTRHGRTQVVTANPATLVQTAQYLQQYERLWSERYDVLDTLIKEKLV